MDSKLLDQLYIIQNSLSISDFKGCGCQENKMFKLFTDTHNRNLIEFFGSITEEQRAVMLHIINTKLETQ